MHKPRLRFVLVAAASAATLSVLATPTAGAASSGAFRLGSVQQILINRDRAAARRARLNWSACLGTLARRQAAAMAARGTIFHSNVRRSFGCRLRSYMVGENVGSFDGGATAYSQQLMDTTLNNAFMASPHHRANILGRYYRYVGTAWAQGGGGSWFIAVEFG